MNQPQPPPMDSRGRPVSLNIANKPADEMHLVSTEDVQYQPFISVWELHVLGEDHNLEPPRKTILRFLPNH